MLTSLPLTSIPGLIAQRAASHADETIVRTKHRGIWKTVTWSQLAERVRQIGTALLAANIGRGDVVAILSETRPDAILADLAILGCGAASVALDPDDDADRACHKLSSSGSRLAFVENEEQLDKLLSIRARCPALSLIVVFDMKGLRDFNDPNCVALSAFAGTGDTGSAFAGTGDTGSAFAGTGDTGSAFAGTADTGSAFAGTAAAASRFGETAAPADWTAAVHSIAADQPAVIQFPRGDAAATGRILTHGDLMHMIAVARARLPIEPNDERLAVLRMSDITERVGGLYLALETRCISNYPEGTDTVIENLRELQPTVLGADAAVWEGLHGLAAARAKDATPTQRLAYEWSLRAGRAGGSRARAADLLVLHAVRREFGLNRLRLAYVGGASVGPAALDWARSLGIAIQRIDEPLIGASAVDERYQALMQNAYA